MPVFVNALAGGGIVGVGLSCAEILFGLGQCTVCMYLGYVGCFVAGRQMCVNGI